MEMIQTTSGTCSLLHFAVRLDGQLRNRQTMSHHQEVDVSWLLTKTSCNIERVNVFYYRFKHTTVTANYAPYVNLKSPTTYSVITRSSCCGCDKRYLRGRTSTNLSHVVCRVRLYTGLNNHQPTNNHMSYQIKRPTGRTNTANKMGMG